MIAAVVVWYNPTQDYVKNILTYIDGVDRVYIVDNSSIDNQILLPTNDKLEYLPFYENRGIASALNLGTKHAKEAGFEWVLTMDQDSHFSRKYIIEMFRVLNRVESADSIGIIAAVPSCSAEVDKGQESDWDYIQTAFTSGNLVRISAWSAALGWDEDMFIDSVDYDFDFKVQLAGFKIVQCNKIVFSHTLGNKVTRLSFLGRKIIVSTNHNYIRRYYITRNRFYLTKKYKTAFPDFIRCGRWFNIKEIIRIVFLESDKWRKLMSMWYGYKDYCEGKLGKFDR